MITSATTRRQAFSRLGLLSAAALTALSLATAGSASANGWRTVLDESFNAACTGVSQSCGDPFVFQFTTLSPKVNVDFTAGAAGCSTIVPVITIDGLVMPPQSAVAPGQSTGGQDFRVGIGSHTIGIDAYGLTGGCNTGKLASYQGHVHINCVDVFSNGFALTPDHRTDANQVRAF
jgi:hypothetical protein